MAVERGRMGWIRIGLYALLGGATIYAFAGLCCFRPGVAVYDSVGSHPVSATESEYETRLVGPARRSWFESASARWPWLATTFEPWVHVWHRAQMGHFPSAQTVRIPDPMLTEPATSTIVWHHHFLMEW